MIRSIRRRIRLEILRFKVEVGSPRRPVISELYCSPGYADPTRVYFSSPEGIIRRVGRGV